MEARKSRRGGKRLGAGRKPKNYVPPSALSDIDVAAALAAPPPTPADFQSTLRLHAPVALKSLTTVMLYSSSDSAKIAAANAILDRGFGKPSTDTGIDMVLPLFGQAFLGTAPGETVEASRKLANLAATVLVKIAENSASHSARVSAARSLLDRGIATPCTARLDSYRPDAAAIGKKDLAAAAAATAGAGTEWGDDLSPLAFAH